jgi:hypothetical protein
MAKRQTTEFWQGHLEGWRQSGLTQVAYCASFGLGIKSFHRWRRKERDAAQSAKLPLTLVPLSLGAPATGSVVRLHSPGGWRIELPMGRVPWLADLLRQLP